jgi:enoyl-CoA hydratase
MSLTIETIGSVRIITIDRPGVRNAVDGPTAVALFDAFAQLDGDDDIAVAILTGADGTFCSGADLSALASGAGNHVGRESPDEIVGSLGPMGPTRLRLGKPVIAAIEGYAVAGGLELAVWCDLRVAATDAKLGVFCRRWGVPLIDGGTVRLPRLIGESRAADLILTGREVTATEAHRMGLVNRLAEPGGALPAAIELARQLAEFPQLCLRSDRASMYGQNGLGLGAALCEEVEVGLATIRSGETRAGAQRFAEGGGRHGRFD